MPLRGARRVLVAAALVLSGCTAVLGVNDVFFDEGAPQGAGSVPGGDGGPGRADGTTGGDGDTTTCVADLQTDPKHCGRCGHDCLGGPCNQGVCAPVELGAVAGGRLYRVATSDADVFVTGVIRLTTDAKGVWRVPKSGGTATPFVTLEAAGIAVIDQSLYFAVADAAANGTDTFGGVYECPLAPSPCTNPRLVTATTDTYELAVDRGKLFFSDRTAGRLGIYAYTPGGAATLFRADYSPYDSWVDGEDVFYSATFYGGSPRATVSQIFPDAGYTEIYSFPSPSAQSGSLTGSASAVFFAAHDDGTRTSGVVRRIPRVPGVTPCDYGAQTNKRPTAVYQDGRHVYWTNGGEGTDPWQGGSVARCDVGGCCATPEAVIWTGDAQPMGIAGDDRAVYWVGAANGAIWKVAKP